MYESIMFIIEGTLYTYDFLLVSLPYLINSVQDHGLYNYSERCHLLCLIISKTVRLEGKCIQREMYILYLHKFCPNNFFCRNKHLASYLRDVLSIASRSPRKMFISVAQLEGNKNVSAHFRKRPQNQYLSKCAQRILRFLSVCVYTDRQTR